MLLFWLVGWEWSPLFNLSSLHFQHLWMSALGYTYWGICLDAADTMWNQASKHPALIKLTWCVCACGVADRKENALELCHKNAIGGNCHGGKMKHERGKGRGTVLNTMVRMFFTKKRVRGKKTCSCLWKGGFKMKKRAKFQAESRLLCTEEWRCHVLKTKLSTIKGRRRNEFTEARSGDEMILDHEVLGMSSPSLLVWWEILWYLWSKW